MLGIYNAYANIKFLGGTAFQHPAVRKCFAGVPAMAVKVLKPHHITLFLTFYVLCFPILF